MISRDRSCLYLDSFQKAHSERAVENGPESGIWLRTSILVSWFGSPIAIQLPSTTFLVSPGHRPLLRRVNSRQRVNLSANHVTNGSSTRTELPDPSKNRLEWLAPNDFGLPFDSFGVENRALDASAFVVPPALVVAHFGDTGETDADSTRHRRLRRHLAGCLKNGGDRRRPLRHQFRPSAYDA